jgi:hypothetical protein
MRRAPNSGRASLGRRHRHANSVSVGSDGSVLVAGYTSGTLPGQSSAGGRTRLCGSTTRRATNSGRGSLGRRARLRLLGERGQRRQRAGRGVHGSAPFRGNRAQAARTRSCGSTMRRAPRSGRASLGPRAFDVRLFGERGQRRQRAGRGVHGRHPSGAIERRRQDAFVRKYDAAGAEVWTRQFGTANDDIAWSVSVGSDGSVLVAGYTFGTLPGQSSAGGRTRLCGSTMRRAPRSGRASLGARAPTPPGR